MIEFEHDGVRVEAVGLEARHGPAIFLVVDDEHVQQFWLDDVETRDGEEVFIVSPQGRTVTDGMRAAIREAGGRIER